MACRTSVLLNIRGVELTHKLRNSSFYSTLLQWYAKQFIPVLSKVFESATAYGRYILINKYICPLLIDKVLCKTVWKFLQKLLFNVKFGKIAHLDDMMQFYGMLKLQISKYDNASQTFSTFLDPHQHLTCQPAIGLPYKI